MARKGPQLEALASREEIVREKYDSLRAAAAAGQGKEKISTRP